MHGYTEGGCHASASPSDAHGNKFLKECGRKPVCRGAPSQKHFSNRGGGGGGTHQSTQGLYKEGSVVAKRQMQNNLHEKPDHDPSSSSSSSRTVSPSPTQLLQNIKAHLCHIKAERQGSGVEGGGGILVAVRSRTEDFSFRKAKNIFPSHMRDCVWLVVQQT